ncbi:MAG: circadian clock protein KaiA [Synechococcales cyanobacterium T60_A2020_003]|nr:circadian clock protein KaiA [Synechococcales cyanobacterium T60_A2020_003]
MHAKFSVCTLLHTPSLIDVVRQALQDTCQTLNQFLVENDFLTFVDREKHHIDCLVIESSAQLDHLFKQLHQRAILLPTVVLEIDGSTENSEKAVEAAIAALESKHAKTPYQQAALRIMLSQIEQIDQFIEQAISKFLKLSPPAKQADSERLFDPMAESSARDSLVTQQKRLADRLKERLGYLGVYYKRNPSSFMRYMNQDERKEFLKLLKESYQEIILCYFARNNERKLNDKIDNFVNMAFFSDVPVSQVVELHMALMDEFAKQLKLEGRSEEILLDYRLTLIDVLANLCEMYRRSIPRET